MKTFLFIGHFSVSNSFIHLYMSKLVHWKMLNDITGNCILSNTVGLVYFKGICCMFVRLAVDNVRNSV